LESDGYVATKGDAVEVIGSKLPDSKIAAHVEEMRKPKEGYHAAL
jgi:hypothetical protein